MTVAQEAQAVSPRPLITQSLDETQLTRLTGNTHPLARPQFDLGTAPATLPMDRMLLVLKRSPEQEAALEKLMDDQQDKNSPNFHKWLTPEEFGQKFGPTDADMQTITGWLQSHGFQVGSTKGRTVLEFSGSASQVQEAFHTSIHEYIVNGEQHWANATDPSIPTALVPAVAGIVSLNDFRRKAMNNFLGTYSEETKKLTSAQPNFTFSCGNGSTCYALGPYDFATIYDVLPLWTAGIDGTGQTIAVVGRTNINPADATNFWSLFGLTVPQNKLTVTFNGPDPGINGDEGEADIDIQWSGAVAPKALINFVTSQSTNTTDGVDLSALYVIENNLASVMSESYGACELGMGTAGNQFYYTIWAQAAAQGISVMVSSGDNGSAGCDQPNGPAQYGLNVNGIASTPFDAAVGGTDFNQYKKWSTYWNSSNNTTTQQSAKGYIPETTWNDSCTNALAITLGYGSTAEQACNNPQMLANGGVISVAGSGGPSNCVTNTQGVIGSCTNGYRKPSWQTGTGTQTDQLRDLPDISLFASDGFMGSFYVVCQQDQTGGTCSLSSFAGYGGTSVAAPAFAGIMALVNQNMGSPQGVPGFALYQLISKQPNAFHDIPSGSTIAPPCLTGTPNCHTNTAGDSYGILTGYSTTTAYDLATGLGSVDAANLVNNWNKATFTATTAALTLNGGTTVSNVTHGTAVPVNIALTPTAATGNAALLVDVGPGTTTGKAIDFFSLSGGMVSSNTSVLPAGTYSVIAHYGGDGTYGGSYSNPVSVTVTPENSTVSLPGLQLGGNTVTTVKYDDPYTLFAQVENANQQTCNPPPFGEVTCPTGSISLTDGTTPLGRGPYTLDPTASILTPAHAFILSGGTHTLSANYNGDSNYNTGSASVGITVTPAATTIATPYVSGGTVGGQGAYISITVSTTSYGAAPTGTVTFYVNGTAQTGTPTYSWTSGYGYAYLYASFLTGANAFPSPGTYAITASYSGDSNYSGSTSPPTNITVLYPPPIVTMTPTTQTVNYGGTATISALVSSNAKNVSPTGTITFTDGGKTVAGPTTCTNTTDSNGNYACQASATFTVADGFGVTANYGGDSNYPPSSGYASIVMPDFYLSLNPYQITATAGGPPQNVTLSIASQSGFAGAITSFSCSGLPAETTCTFSPSQVTANPTQSVSTTLTIATTAIGQSRPAMRAARLRPAWFSLVGMLLIGACFIGLSSTRNRGLPLGLMVLAIALMLPSCGGGGGTGGGSGGGGAGGASNPVPHITSLSPSQAAAGSQISNLTIDGSNFMLGSTVTVGGTMVSGYMSVPSSSQMIVYPSPSQLATVGQLPVVVTNPPPGGGPSNTVDFNVTTGTPTGNFFITITASSGGLTHSIQMYLTVQ